MELPRAFTSFADYSEYIHRQANLALTGAPDLETIAAKIEVFVSEWLEICAQNETMHPIEMRGFRHDARQHDVGVLVGFPECASMHLYTIAGPYRPDDIETTLTCWIKVSFFLKMKLCQLDYNESHYALTSRRLFCDEWALLQHKHAEARPLEFVVSPNSQFAHAHDRVWGVYTENLLQVDKSIVRYMAPHAAALWEAGTGKRRMRLETLKLALALFK